MLHWFLFFSLHRKGKGHTARFKTAPPKLRWSQRLARASITEDKIKGCNSQCYDTQLGEEVLLQLWQIQANFVLRSIADITERLFFFFYFFKVKEDRHTSKHHYTSSKRLDCGNSKDHAVKRCHFRSYELVGGCTSRVHAAVKKRVLILGNGCQIFHTWTVRSASRGRWSSCHSPVVAVPTRYKYGMLCCIAWPMWPDERTVRDGNLRLNLTRTHRGRGDETAATASVSISCLILNGVRL